jgi:hypothetical protein
VPCADVRVFTNVVRASQKADDNVTLWLNRSEARTAAQCSALFRAFADAHTRRAAAVQRCVRETQAALSVLMVRADAPDADASARSSLTAARAKVRDKG